MVGTELLRTGLPERGPEFEPIYETNVFHELLVMHVPADAHRVERRETAVFPKLRRAVYAVGQVGVIPVVERIVGVKHQSHGAGSRLSARWLAAFLVLQGIGRKVEVFVCKALEHEVVVAGEVGCNIPVGCRIQKMFLCEVFGIACRECHFIIC